MKMEAWYYTIQGSPNQNQKSVHWGSSIKTAAGGDRSVVVVRKLSLSISLSREREREKEREREDDT